VRASASGGAGWMMSYLELLMTEYHQSHRQALFATPLTTAYALFNTRASRLGLDRPGYADAAAGAARERVKAYFQTNYQILPDPAPLITDH
jgi:hypothetical protein